jgi:hypothetical protein
MMSSAGMPEENIPGIVKAIPGLGPKPFAFPPESLFAFSPERCSRSPRNPFRLRPESSPLPALEWLRITKERALFHRSETPENQLKPVNWQLLNLLSCVR